MTKHRTTSFIQTQKGFPRDALTLWKIFGNFPQRAFIVICKVEVWNTASQIRCWDITLFRRIHFCSKTHLHRHSVIYSITATVRWLKERSEQRIAYLLIYAHITSHIDKFWFLCWHWICLSQCFTFTYTLNRFVGCQVAIICLLVHTKTLQDLDYSSGTVKHPSSSISVSEQITYLLVLS